MRCRICAIFSVASTTISGPVIWLSPTSAQQRGDRHLRPYSASNGAACMLDLCIACHGSDVNRASRSEMIEVGTPCLETTSLR
ncbi:hypothetical protein Hanom_Chr11g00982761 [Helianthus anomalus]